MLDNFIPLISSYLPMWDYALIYVFAGMVIAFVGAFIHSLLRR